MRETWDALDAPLTFKHLLGIGLFLGVLAALGFISPFDRLSKVEASLEGIKDSMVTKADLEKALSNLQLKPSARDNS